MASAISSSKRGLSRSVNSWTDPHNNHYDRGHVLSNRPKTIQPGHTTRKSGYSSKPSG